MAAVTTHDDPGTVDGRRAAFTAPGEGVNLFFWAPKSLQMATAVMKLKGACSLEEKL